ncbi:MAG: hypothetical protein RR209_02580 [Angelakisella sp.]
MNSNSIISSVVAQLHRTFPARSIYISLCPKDFTRPCFLVQMTDYQSVPADAVSNKCTVTVDIICFDEIDAYGNTDMLKQLLTQSAVQELFTALALTVEDRVLTVSAVQGGRDFEAATITMRMEFFSPRPKTQSLAPTAAGFKVTLRNSRLTP